MSEGCAPLLLAGPRDTRPHTRQRAKQQRAAWRRFDPLFAATLVNQIMPPEAPPPQAYATPPRGPRCGIVVNVQA